MKLYLDENIDPKVAKALREKGFDVISTYDIKANGRPDDEQLKIAIKERMAIVTYNLKDYILLAKEYISKGKSHYGIILVSNKSIPQGVPGILVNALESLLIKKNESLENEIVYLIK